MMMMMMHDMYQPLKAIFGRSTFILIVWSGC